MERLERMVETGFSEIKQAIGGLDARLRNLENNEASCRGVQELRLAELEKQIGLLTDKNNELATQNKALEDRVETMEPWFHGLKWLTGILGASVVALIWGILTHTITLAFH